MHGQILHTLEVDVIPSTSWIVDQKRIFYESECRHINVRLNDFRKNLSLNNQLIKNNLNLQCTLSKSNLRWDDANENDVIISLKTPEANKSLLF